MIEEFSGFFRRLKFDNDRLALIPRGSSVFAGISGGVDSVVLLHYLCWLRERQPLEVTVIHFNHHLRPTAVDDAEFVCALAQRYAVGCRLIDLDVKSAARERERGIEEAARYLRRKFWQEQVPCDSLVATGHHRDDVAETVLINLTRGTGLSGLTSLAPQNDRYVRPLLGVSRAEILAFAQANNLTWCEDESNATDDYLRNRIRHRLLPIWSELAGFDVASQLAQVATNLLPERKFLEGIATEILAAILTDCPTVIKLKPLRETTPNLRRLTLELYFQKLGITDVGSKHFQIISDIIVKNSRARFCHLPHGLIFERKKQVMILRGYHGSKS